jgi:colanic acid/amylovoran biosynthesis glycosyltransferase
MEKKNIIIITSAFPFPPGEQFLEDEIIYWGKTSYFDEITILPFSAAGKARDLPKGIKVDTSLAKKRLKKFYRFFCCIKFAFSAYLYKEILFMIKTKKIKLKNIISLFACASTTLQVFKHLKSTVSKQKDIDCIYSYWNDATAYGAALAKKEGIIKNVVSRAHRFDVYEERRINGYMPLKRQFAKYFDSIFVLSESARTYMHETYGIPFNILQVARLGVPLPKKIALSSESGRLNIISVSFCVQVKRIDKIIEAIARFADLNGFTHINWEHIGDGPLFIKLNKLAQLKLSPKKNVTFRFHGLMSNVAVKSFYNENKIDVFINTSESEGIPVSIMEAMAAGVLPIAPDVGGVSDLVSNEFGTLLSNNPTVDEITTAIGELAIKSKNSELRGLARAKIECDFNSDKNYKSFIDILNLMVKNDSI